MLSIGRKAYKRNAGPARIQRIGGASTPAESPRQIAAYMLPPPDGHGARPRLHGNFTSAAGLRPDADRLLESAAHLGWLAVLPTKAGEARLEHRDGLEFLERNPFDAAHPFHVRQFDAFGD